MEPVIAGGPVHAIPESALRRRGTNIGGGERWLSAIGGSALVLYGLRRKSVSGLLLAALGGALVSRGATGRSRLYQALGRPDTRPLFTQADGRQAIAMAPAGAIRAQRSITINRPREEVYAFFRDFENLPRFMWSLDRVEVLSPMLSRWAQRGPTGDVVEWDVEVIDDERGARILWRATDPERIRCAGTAHFTEAPGERGTEVSLIMDFDPPGGVVGQAATMVKEGGPNQALRGDLRRLKQLLEMGEIPTMEGQPSGRKGE